MSNISLQDRDIIWNIPPKYWYGIPSQEHIRTLLEMLFNKVLQSSGSFHGFWSVGCGHSYSKLETNIFLPLGLSVGISAPADLWAWGYKNNENHTPGRAYLFRVTQWHSKGTSTLPLSQEQEHTDKTYTMTPKFFPFWIICSQPHYKSNS